MPDNPGFGLHPAGERGLIREINTAGAAQQAIPVPSSAVPTGTPTGGATIERTESRKKLEGPFRTRPQNFQETINRFKDDPLAALGFVLTEVGAALQQKPSPGAAEERFQRGAQLQERRVDIEEEGLKLRQKNTFFKAIDNGMDLLRKTPLDRQGEVIDLFGRTVKIPSIAGYLKALLLGALPNFEGQLEELRKDPVLALYLADVDLSKMTPEQASSLFQKAIDLRLEIRGETAKEGIIKPADLRALATTASQTAIRMLELGSDPADVAATLQTLGTNPSSQRVVASIISSLPASQDEFRRAKTKTELAPLEARKDRLVEAGVPEDIATILTFGKGGASIALKQPGPAELSDKEKVALRGDLSDFDAARFALEQAIPLIDADTVGLWAAFSRTFGGIGQQIPGVKQILDAIPGLGLDEATVQKAITARNAFLITIEQLKAFVVNKGSRKVLSNQDRDFVTKLSGFVDKAQTPEAVRETANRMLELIAKMRGATEGQLTSGEISLTAPGSTPSGGVFKAEIDEAGNVVVKDASGAVQFRQVAP